MAERKIVCKRATMSEFVDVLACDEGSTSNALRLQHIKSAIDSGLCFLASNEKEVVGFGLIHYHFFDNGFLTLLVVAPASRRRGVGIALLKYIERSCQTEKFFTSTNESNSPMRALLDQLGYQQSGTIYNLDVGDPELVYFKALESEVEYRIRPASSEDFHTAYHIKKDALGPYIEETWGWDEALQLQYHQREFNPGDQQIIESEGKPIGLIHVAESSSETSIHGIYLMSSHQRKGIGTSLLRRIIKRSREKGLPITLQYLKVNPVRYLYQRLGFVINGENEDHFSMVLR